MTTRTRPKRLAAGALLLALIGSGAAASAHAPAQEAAKRGVHVLSLRGSPLERGLAHGQALRPEIQHLVRAWKADLEETHGRDPDELIRLFLAETDFVPAIERWTPGLMDEVRGIAQGCEIDFETILAYQLPDEMWANAGEIAREHCTSLGADAQDGRPTFVAQNLDIPTWYHTRVTVLHLEHQGTDLESLVVTVPGLVGANGMNNRAVGVCVNTLLQLKPSRSGLPVAFVVRGVLSRESHAESLEFLHAIEHASGQNYIVAGPEAAPGFECSERLVARFLPFEGARWTYHTNHPLVNENYRPSILEALRRSGESPGESPWHCDRFASLQERLKPGTRVDLERIKETLRSRDPGVPIDNPSTYACTIMVLSEEPELHIAPGRPHEVPFEVLRF